MTEFIDENNSTYPSSSFFPSIKNQNQFQNYNATYGTNLGNGYQSTFNSTNNYDGGWSGGNALTGISENQNKHKQMQEDNKAYMRQVQQEQSMKPRRLRQRNEDNVQDNAYIFDNRTIYDVSPETKGKQRYENSYQEFNTNRPQTKASNNNPTILPSIQRTQHTQSMPNLQGVRQFNSLTTIPEERSDLEYSHQPQAQGQGSDVKIEHYVNGDNQKVNKMTINRIDTSYNNRPETNHMRPDTQGGGGGNFQNYNWNQGGYDGRGTTTAGGGYIPPPTAALGKNLWNQGHIQERYVDAELRKSKYGDELRQQMQQDESRKRFNKLEDKVQDFNFLDEFYSYNPYGKGGGGAPLRDQFGNMITSRKPQFRNDMAKNYANRKLQYSVMSSNRPMTKRAPTSYINDFGKPRDLNTRNVNTVNYHGVQHAQGGNPFEQQQQPQQQQQQVQQYQGGGANVVQQQQPLYNQIVNPDYFVQQKAVEADYVRGDAYPYAWQGLPNYYDWVAWYNEMLSLLYQDRLAREEEDKLRKSMLEEEAEKLKREKAEMKQKYQDEFDQKFRHLMDLQEDQMKRQQEYWETRHNDELSRWQEMLRLRPYVDRIDNYDALRMTQGLVDYLQNSVRFELGKIKTETADNDKQIQKRINNLKSSLKNTN